MIQPHLQIRLPCYDFTPITSFTFGHVLLAVRLWTSGPPGSHGVTGGVYKARERMIRLPCYDFTPITSFTFGHVLLAVRLWTSGPPGSHGVTGGVYKARERIHRGMLIRDY